MPTAVDELAVLRSRLATDFEFFAANCLRIVDKQRRLVPFRLNDAQRRLVKQLEAQRDEGKPMRAQILKARRIGFSTLAQGLVIQSVTQQANHDALVVAQDKKTGGALFQMGQLMYSHLPPDPDLGIKPPIRSRRRKNSLEFGNPSRLSEDTGDVGINSSLTVDTAQELEAGRGQTLTEVHASEVAFWPDIETKLLGLLSAVPEDPQTLVLLESTANGNNFFRDLWDQAEDGANGYIPFFSPWQEDPANQLPFADDADREEFIQMVGSGPYGEEEPYLQERFQLTPEQLHWRRRRIDRPDIGGDLRKFHQEFPAYPKQAFISTGSHVFDQRRVQLFVDRTLRETDPRTPTESFPGPKLGVLTPGRSKMQKGRSGMVEVPVEAKWTPADKTSLGLRHPYWRVWETPDPDGRYLVVIDPAEGEEIERGESDYSAIQVINHRTRDQAAEYRSRLDTDLVGMQGYLAALYWNQAIIVVEKTGVGDGIARRLYHDFKWPASSFYRRKQLDSTRDREGANLGWSTDRKTKDMLVQTGTAVLRESADGGDWDVVRSRFLAEEMTSYMRDERGRTAARKGRHDDLLMAWMIGHEVAQIMRPRPHRKQQVKSMISDTVQRRWSVR
jgi:hypothetical protein